MGADMLLLSLDLISLFTITTTTININNQFALFVIFSICKLSQIICVLFIFKIKSCIR